MIDREPVTGAQPVAVIADDDELIRSVLLFALEDLNFRVLEAASGTEAIALVAANPVDLVILDVHFPGEVFERVWEDLSAVRAPHTGVILLSGDSAAPATAHGERVAYLSKPVELVEFQSNVRRLLEPSPTAQQQPAPEAT